MSDPGLLSLVRTRPMREGDKNFVRSSWLRSYRVMCEWVPQDEFMRIHHDVVEGLLVRSRTIVAVAHDDDDQILGWACGEPGERRPLMHWCYVKSAFRGNGIASRLVGETLDGSGPPDRIVRTMTHLPPYSMLSKLNGRGWAIHPTLAFYLALEGTSAA